MLILVLECSTSAAKALVYDTRSGVRGQCSEPFDKSVSDASTQDADGAFDRLTRCGRKACEQAGGTCDAVMLVSTWHSLLLCGQDGHPRGRVRLWSDLSAASAVARFSQTPHFKNDFYSRTGCIAHATYPVFKYAYLKERLGLDESVQIYAEGEYFFERLTGMRAVAKNIASGSGFFNLFSLGWDDRMLAAAGVSRTQLGVLCDEDFSAPLSDNGAKALGLPMGTPVFAGGADGATTQLGCGAAEPGIMTMSVGTSAALRIACDAPLLPKEMTSWCYYLAAGKHIAGAATNGACNCVNAFQEKSGLSIWKLDEMLDQKDFTDAPIFLPFIFGERCPGWSDAPYGGFVTDGGSLAERYYAILEGVLFNLYQCFLPLRRAGGVPKEIRLSGGILNCRYWMQMCADIFDCEINAAAMQHASLLGGVVLAAKAFGENLSGRIWSTENKVVPNRRNREFYAARFKKYLAAYDRAHGRAK